MNYVFFFSLSLFFGGGGDGKGFGSIVAWSTVTFMYVYVCKWHI
jgi:hypothetical protein